MSITHDLDRLFSEALALRGKESTRHYLDYWKSVLPAPPTRPAFGNKEAELISCKVWDALPRLQALIREVIPNEAAARLSPEVPDLVMQLDERIPPFQSSKRQERRNRNYQGYSFSEVLAGGWFYQVGLGEDKEREGETTAHQHREYTNTCLLLFKALELHGAHSAISELDKNNNHVAESEKQASASQPVVSHGVITGPSLRNALDIEELSERLVVCPDFGDDPIEAASWDIHLGTWFRLAEGTNLSAIDVAMKSQRDQIRRHGQAEKYVPFGGTLVLQPRDFVLATTLEYVCVPNHMMAFVEGKSSLGRAGLIIATATQVAPGFRGCIVLELCNFGTVPLFLRPAMRIAQLVFVATDRKLAKKWIYGGESQVQVKP